MEDDSLNQTIEQSVLESSSEKRKRGRPKKIEISETKADKIKKAEKNKQSKETSEKEKREIEKENREMEKENEKSLLQEKLKKQERDLKNHGEQLRMCWQQLVLAEAQHSNLKKSVGNQQHGQHIVTQPMLKAVLDQLHEAQENQKKLQLELNYQHKILTDKQQLPSQSVLPELLKSSDPSNSATNCDELVPGDPSHFSDLKKKISDPLNNAPTGSSNNSLALSNSIGADFSNSGRPRPPNTVGTGTKSYVYTNPPNSVRAGPSNLVRAGSSNSVRTGSANSNVVSRFTGPTGRHNDIPSRGGQPTRKNARRRPPLSYRRKFDNNQNGHNPHPYQQNYGSYRQQNYDHHRQYNHRPNYSQNHGYHHGCDCRRRHNDGCFAPRRSHNCRCDKNYNCQRHNSCNCEHRHYDHED
ncbi:uncharacterized protein LOC127287069 [Leptopilina boulardi]|uniref:uncharacterized protein LOC127287069 n=1 Tax=Leptopilina boulardi TaxID=63433 RepID=UPI0021F5D8E9|nr:uncharacterized protein LOC127287069 [Leptopilina boulardi]